jgi:hypothetical protein
VRKQGFGGPAPTVSRFSPILVRPYALAGSRWEPVVAGLSITLLVLVFIAEKLTPDFVVGAFAVLPMLAAVWVLSRWFAGSVTIVATLLITAAALIEPIKPGHGHLGWGYRSDDDRSGAGVRHEPRLFAREQAPSATDKSHPGDADYARWSRPGIAWIPVIDPPRARRRAVGCSGIHRSRDQQSTAYRCPNRREPPGQHLLEAADQFEAAADSDGLEAQRHYPLSSSTRVTLERSRAPHRPGHCVGSITTAPRAFPATAIWRAAPASESLWTAAIGRVKRLSTKSTASRSSASPSGLT